MQGKAGVIIEDIAGCGKFQVILSVLVYFLANSASAFTVLFMSFGNYNPGWRCNDPMNTSETITNNASFTVDQNADTSENLIAMFLPDPKNTSDIPHENSAFPMMDNCQLFDSCKDIEFNPSSVTIVSEWGLLCEKRWAPSIIASVQMAGIFLGSFLSGHIADAIGRKPTIYIAVLLVAILNVVSIFSTRWEIYAVIRAVQGVFVALILNLYYIFVAEFVPEKWRSVLQGIPAWNVSSVIFTLSCMGLRDWRYITIITASVGFVGFLPVFWIPESLRWLEVKKKTERFNRAVEKVVRMNGKSMPASNFLEQKELSAKTREEEKNNIDLHKYNITHLFRNGYAKRTILLSIPWLSISMVSYALLLGVKILQGNFYTNLIVLNAISIPFSLFPIFMPNLIGRKKSALIFSGIFAICSLGAALMEFAVTSDSVKNTGIPVLVFIAKASSSGVWCILAIYSVELYPTVIRGLGMSWGSTMARLGGILSPFLIPNTKSGASLAYTIMSVIMFISFGIFFFIPETKGKPLRDVYGKAKAGDAKNGRRHDAGDTGDTDDD